MNKGNVRTPCPTRVLLPCPVCGSEHARLIEGNTGAGCVYCGLVVRGSPEGNAIDRWNRLAGAALALERIAALPRAMHLLPQQTPEGVLIDHAARIAREALQR